MTNHSSEKFEQWAIVEIMGHQTYAGMVSEQVIGGASFVRVDVPAEVPFTKMFGASSIYCITPCSEEVVRAAIPRLSQRPINIYMPEIRAIGAANEVVDFGPPDDDEDLEL